MKRITEYTEAELLALTDEQIETLVDYECALQGIALLPEEPTPLEGTGPQPDTVVYSIEGFNKFFLSMDDAARVLEAMNRAKLMEWHYETGAGYRKCLNEVSAYNAPKIQPENVFTAESWAKAKAEVVVREQKTKEYAEAKKAYDAAVSARNEIAETIYEPIATAKRRERARNGYRAQFPRYLSLAENNPHVAMHFLLNVQPGLKDFPEVIEELCPGYTGPVDERAVEDAA